MSTAWWPDRTGLLSPVWLVRTDAGAEYFLTCAVGRFAARGSDIENREISSPGLKGLLLHALNRKTAVTGGLLPISICTK
ncbi:hypothetical protein HPP92_028927 [Vanilla planifolia]|uniref:Uncharacterized protein n=1 Tax=Vanilla planifolia TaxID=51239 RepID=A0A835P6P2_VANPL|nr:hypothetical protein HPP92_028927 [Vanilla planifolia]